MRRVIVESPYRAKTPAEQAHNLRYLRAALRDSLKRGEAPFASHALYTQDGVLDDGDAEERALGIEAGLIWGACAERSVFYMDLGVSEGMRHGLRRAEQEGRYLECRWLYGEWSTKKAADGGLSDI